jgi:cytochrome c oxidase assembly protein subunit 15
VAAVVLALLGFQFVLGLADVLLLAPVWMQIVHLLGADLYWVALVSLATLVIWPKAGDRLLSQADHRSF